MKTWKAWTRTERWFLAQHFGKRLPEELSEDLGRLPKAVAGEVSRMKLSSRQRAYRKEHLLTPEGICKMLSLKRPTVDRMFELGLPHCVLPGRVVSLPEDLGAFLRERPEIINPETLSPQVRARLGFVGSYEPPNFKWFRCGKNQSSQWANVWVTHPRVWFCKDLFKTKSGMCPVCNRGMPLWADAYSNECATEVHEGGRMPRGLWAAPPKRKVLLDSKALFLLEASFIREYLPEPLQTPQWPFLQAPQWPPQAQQSPQA